MIRANTVFILGAGASKPYGYPTAAGLRAYICENFPGMIRGLSFGRMSTVAAPTADMLRDRMYNEAWGLADKFKRSSTPSIDLFLARNPEHSDIGRNAIVMSILEKEKRSRFHEDMDDDYKSQDWYSHVFRKMTEELTEPESFERFKENRVTFVTFNYDRSLDFFLHQSLSSSFGRAAKEAIVAQLNEIPILHVYGSVDNLPWQGGGSEYSADYSSLEVERMSKNINIVYESSGNDVRIQDAIKKANQIFFLGFSYAKENLEVLGIQRCLNSSQAIYGTALHSTAWERAVIVTRLTTWFANEHAGMSNPTIKDCNCIQLLREHL
jgi:hypothetical protein